MKTPAVCFVVLWLGLLPLHAASKPVRVEIAPVQVTRRTFDPNQPPAEMPKLMPPEVGTCVFKFECRMETQAEESRLTSAHVSEVQIRARLVVAIWTPIGGPARVLAHEEGHRDICEMYYRPAQQIAERIARGVIGAPLASVTKPAMEQELDVIQKQSIAEFLRETATRCEAAQQRFDAVTNHSINAIPVGDAIARAVAEERSAYASQAPGRPPALRLPPTRPAATAYGGR